MMTDENLSEVQIVVRKNGHQYDCGMTLNGTQTVENTDGTLTGHFYMDGGVYVEDEYSGGHILLERRDNRWEISLKEQGIEEDDQALAENT